MTQTRTISVAAAFLAVAVTTVVIVWLQTDKPVIKYVSAQSSVTPRSKVLYVDSYHEGYPWSESITQGILGTLRITRKAPADLYLENSLFQMRIVRMDTKRNSSEQFKVEAALKVKKVIDSWKPDVVICADDNASQYVIVPYYKNSDIPFVFCGVNWDASVFGPPCHNVTGMIEVSAINSLIDNLQPYARGTRIGLLAARDETNAKEAANYVNQCGLKLEKTVYVDTLREWKQAYLQLQSQVDMLIIAPPSFLAAGSASPADQAQARRFVLENSRIPSGSVEDWIAPYSLMCFAKRGSEQGEWAATAALRILAGTKPEDIPIARNQDMQIYLNMPLANKLKIKFPVHLVEQATILSKEK